jgi:hypothetical protein
MKLHQLNLAILLAIGASSVHAATTIVGASNVTVQNNSTSIIWNAPAGGDYKVSVLIGYKATASNALYRVYPKGNTSNNTACLKNEATSPCFEIPVNQALMQGRLVQLKLDGNVNTKWKFVANKGFVSLTNNNVSASEVLDAGTAQFEGVATIAVYPKKGYSKIANNGLKLAKTAKMGSNENSWACTRDNATGLMWELKTGDNGVRDKSYTYSWFNPNLGSKGGSANKGTCFGGETCDTDGYVKTVNNQSLCGYKDWRLPSADELVHLINSVILSSTKVKATYFPNTSDKSIYWSSTLDSTNNSNAKGGYVWSYFGVGHEGRSDSWPKSDSYPILLVRNTQ